MPQAANPRLSRRVHAVRGALPPSIRVAREVQFGEGSTIRSATTRALAADPRRGRSVLQSQPHLDPRRLFSSRLIETDRSCLSPVDLSLAFSVDAKALNCLMWGTRLHSGGSWPHSQMFKWDGHNG